VWLTSFEHTPEFHFWTFWFLFIRFTSDPTDAKTDSDQLDDAEERKLHTNPRDEQTYTIVENQTARIRNLTTGQNTSNLTYMTQMGVDASLTAGTDYPNIELTDATADFDFVRTDEPGLDQFTFLALDGQPRTDTWFPNQAELTADTDPWHPDTDNDGLTDGQEARWLTLLAETAEDLTSVEVTPAAPRSSPQSRCQGSGSTFYECPTVGELGTEPTTADSDDDDYWDGWFGVYGVDRANASNHILYRHHLQTGGGVSGSETLTQQARVHEVGSVTDRNPDPFHGQATPGADIDDDNQIEHSAIHVGERHWETDPNTNNSQPEPEISIEADFIRGTPSQTMDRQSWENGIEENYALYGIDVDLTRDDIFSTTEGVLTRNLYPDWSDPRDTDADEHLVVIDQIPDWLAEQIQQQSEIDVSDKYGFNPERDYIEREFSAEIFEWRISADRDLSARHFLLTSTMYQDANNQVDLDDVARSRYHSRTEMFGALTEIHEIGHSLAIGEADDATTGEYIFENEVYSGDVSPPPAGASLDSTDESIARGNDWSIMRAGWSNTMVFEHDSAVYFAFSLEELTTVEERDTG